MKHPEPKDAEHAAAIVAGALAGVNIARMELRGNPEALKALADGLHVAGSRTLETKRIAEREG